MRSLGRNKRSIQKSFVKHSHKISALAARRLVGRHGTLAWKVLELGAETPTGFQVVEPYEPVLEYELRWVIRHEHVHHLRDLSARVRLGLGADLGLQSIRRAGHYLCVRAGALSSR